MGAVPHDTQVGDQEDKPQTHVARGSDEEDREGVAPRHIGDVFVEDKTENPKRGCHQICSERDSPAASNTERRFRPRDGHALAPIMSK